MARMLRPYRPEHVIGDFANGRTVDNRAGRCSTAAGTSSRSGEATSRSGSATRSTTRSGRSGSRHTQPDCPTSGSSCSRPVQSTRFRVAQLLEDRRRAGFAARGHRSVSPDSLRTRSTRRRAPPATPVSWRSGRARRSGRRRRSTRAASIARCATAVTVARADEEKRTDLGRESDGLPVRFTVSPPRNRWPSVPVPRPVSGPRCGRQRRSELFRNWSLVPRYPTHLLSSFPATALYRDGRFRATTFISEAFARSQCFQTGGATCASCHDPHPPDAATESHVVEVW